jgi:hypothetical protein
VLGDQVSIRERIMPVGLPTAIETAEPDQNVETVRGGLTLGPIHTAVALSVFMFGMLARADIAAWVMPPVQDDGGAPYLLRLLPPSPWQTR